MAILHGSWIPQPHFSSRVPVAASIQAADAEGYFFVWGEIWRRIEPIALTAPKPRRGRRKAAPDNDTTDAPALPEHPFAMTSEELVALLRTLHDAHQLQWAVTDFPLDLMAPVGSSTRQRKSTTALASRSPRWQVLPIAIPTHPLVVDEAGTLALLPQHSETAGPRSIHEGDTATDLDLTLASWNVPGVYLKASEALKFLHSLPLSSVQDEESAWLGDDLRYWSHVARWQLDLLARSKFLPRLGHVPEPDPQDGATAFAHWQVLIDSATDQERLEAFADRMPPACRTYSAIAPVSPDQTSVPDLPEPSSILLSFLNATLDLQVRAIVASHPLPTQPLLKDVPLREWLQALGNSPTLKTDATRLERLETALVNWTAPYERQLSQQLTAFRTCFYLQPPGPGQADWTLEYYLQATSNPDFLVNARVIWNNPVERLEYMGRTIDQPQERLLAGLGLASRLYPLLEPSLQAQKPQASRLNPNQVYEFIRSIAWRLQDSGFGVILPTGLSNQEGWANRLGLRIQAETPKPGSQQRLGLQSLLNFKWELTIGGQRLSKPEFDRLVALNTPLVEINGEWVELRPQDVKAAQAFFESRKDQLALSLEDALRISTGDTQVIEKLPVLGFEASGALQELINTLTTGNQSLTSIPTPTQFQGELRPYQMRGLSWLAFLEQWGLGACLADDMGLGKTAQLIALMLHLQEQGVLEQPSLIVCPTSVLGNWEREVKRFGPSLKVLVHHGDKRSQGKAFAKAIKDKHLVITSYSLVHRDAKDLQSVAWQGIVLDEAQNIKNADSKQSQAVRQLNGQFRIALTGTPVENRLTELWAILEFLNPGYLGPKNFFQRRFAVPIERYGDTASLKTLRSLVQPFILRRLKTDRSIIQDLPEKQEMTVFCGLTAEQAALYQKLVEQSLVDIESSEGIQRRGMILALLVKLKQICNHPALYQPKGGESAAEEDPVATLDHAVLSPNFRLLSGKLQRLDEMLEEVLAEGDRSLIFTQFASWGKRLQTYLEHKFNRQVLFLYGGTSQKQREEMIDRFQNDPQGPRIFILSLKAGGVGLNLTRANHVFHFDRWWNPAVENQATDRVFRIGQTRNVQVHKFVCTGTLEERIHELIESKKALSEQVVGTGENWLTELDSDALRNLLLLDRSAVIDDEDT